MPLSSTRIDIYHLKSLELIFEQSEKLLANTLLMYKETTNKSYIALAAYLTLVSYCFNAIIKEPCPLFWFHVVILFGLIISIIIIWGNLFDTVIVMVGEEPELLVHDYFATQPNENAQIREYYIQIIMGNNDAINGNLTINAKRQRSFLISVGVTIGSLITGVIVMYVRSLWFVGFFLN
jgi:hypothetical protein